MGDFVLNRGHRLVSYLYILALNFYCFLSFRIAVGWKS